MIVSTFINRLGRKRGRSFYDEAPVKLHFDFSLSPLPAHLAAHFLRGKQLALFARGFECWCSPSCSGTLTAPGEAESGSAGTQPDKEYPGEGVPMARQAPAASACQGPPFAPHRPPSLFLRKSDLLLGNTVPLDIGIGYPKVLHRIHLPVPASRRQNLGLRWQLRDTLNVLLSVSYALCRHRSPHAACARRQSPEALVLGRPISFSVPHRDHLLRPRSPSPNF